MSKKSEILRIQRVWATSVGLESDEKGYLPTYEANLFQSMNPETKSSFDQGSGAELVDTPRYPAKMRALHSSSALAVNFFDSWVANSNGPLLEAFGIQGPGGCRIRFEAQYPTGLPGNPPNLDVTLGLPDGEVIGIESKFTEWLSPKPKSKIPFKEKYFPEGSGVWSLVSLPKCQALAEQMRDGAIAFRYLDVAQLLKHALGLATGVGTHFRLFYTFFDANCPEGEVHRREIQEFALAVGTELKFQAISYQSLLAQFEHSASGSEAYRQYLKSRYFAGAA